MANKKKNDGGIFQSVEAWNDVDNFWDGLGTFFGTVGGSAADLGVNVLKGAGRLVEGITDLGGHLIAGGADLIGQDEWADAYRSTVNDSWVDQIASPADEYLDKYSVFGDTGDAVGEGIGQVAAIILTGGALGAAGVGTAGVTAATTGIMGASSMGSGMSEAYLGGATDEEALAYGAMKGAIDAGTELIFGGFGKAVNALGISRGLSSLDDIVAKKLSSGISNQFFKNVVQWGVKSSAEGLEEVLAGIGGAVAKKLTYMTDEQLGQLIEDENLMQQFIVGAVSSGISQSGLIPGMKKGSLIDTTKKGQDFVSGLTASEQKVVDKVFNDLVKQKEADGTKLTGFQKNKLYDSVVEKMESGDIDVETIEDIFKDDVYNDNKAKLDEEDALLKEYEELGKKKSATLAEQTRYKELHEQSKELTFRKDLDSRMSEEVYNRVKGSRLESSYADAARRGETFQADVNEYDEAERATIQSAIDAGFLNNTNKTRRLVNWIAKISAKTGIKVDFTTNEKLKESGFSIDGKSINGYKTKDGIGLNMQSKKLMETVVGHEITHVLEGTELYNEMQKILYEYAESKGELKSRREAISKLYNGVTKDIDSELTAELVGDYLFTDQEFINRLANDNRNLFQKIWDEVKYMWKQAHPSSPEAQKLEKLKRAFEKAYEESGKKRIINKLTGEEIDQNTYEVLERLNKGERVSAEEIANLKEVKEGKLKLDKMITDFLAKHPEFAGIDFKDVGTYLLEDAERIRLREEIISKRLTEGSFSHLDKNGKEVYNGDVKKGKRIDIVIGLPASGKSSAIVNPLSEYYKSVVIDSDIIKTMMPEFNGGWGASLVHEESSKINMDLLEKSMTDGKNIVLPVVGAKVSSIEKYISIAKKMGYAVNVHLNELSNAKATGRMLLRYFNTGRFINPTYTAGYGDKPTEVYKQIKQRGDIDGYSRWSNDVAKDKRPNLTEISENNRLYGQYSATWRASRGGVSAGLAESSKQATGTSVQHSLSEQESSTGDASTYERTDDFRRIQAESQAMSYESWNFYLRGGKNEAVQRRVASVLRGEMDAWRRSGGSYNGSVTLQGKNTQFNMYEGVEPELFHDVFAVARKYLENGELVDLHEVETTDDHGVGYKYCYNYLSDDGLSGFSITPDGDLISVFNAGEKRGFLKAISDIVKSKATTLDCYASPNQNLSEMYERFFGFKTASIMDYNMEYDHDNIAENHDHPPVAFMVNTNSDVKTEHFTKDQYDEAVDYRNSFINKGTQFSISEDPAKADADYLDAVDRGDTETAQRMVDEAAKKAGYTVKGLHATNADFTVFDINKTSDINYHGKGIYFTNSQKDVENNYENYEGPDPWQKIQGRAYELAYDKYGLSYEDTLTSDTEVIDKLNECYDAAIAEFKNTLRRVTAYLKFDNPLILKKGDATNLKGYDISKYDGIIDEQVYEKIGHAGMDENTVHYVVFNPRNIKSADAITYDDNGNVIPLSKRFNTENPDIRFSLSEGTNEATPRDVYFSRIDEVYDKLKGKSAGKSHMVDGYNFFLQRNDFDESAYISITTPGGKKLRQIVDGGNLWKNARLWREAAKMVANHDYPNVATATTQEEAGEYSKIEGKDEEVQKTFKEKVIEGVSDTKNLGKKAVGYLVDKYQPIENLALKTGNRELDAKANTMRTSERAAQHFIGNGADGVRAINDLRQEVEASGLEKEFEEYMYDLLTTDRMSLEDRARPVIKKLGDKFKKLRVDQIKAIAKKPITDNTTDATAQTIRDAKEYLRAISTRNKPVRGDFYTADIARAHATELEQKYPQFKQWAEDVYANTNFMLDKLVADGELSQEAADRFRELYPHYVPIRRVNKEGKAVDVPLYSNRTGIDAPIKGATGGDGTIGYLFKTLAMRAEQTFMAGAKNRFGIELKNTLKAKTTDAEVDVEDIFEEVDTHEDRLQSGEDGQAPTFTVFENGKRVTFEIPEDIYEALKPTPEPLKYTNRFLNAVTKFQRGVLTEYNPFFMLRNAAKDFQDVLINSQHAKETYKNFPEAMRQLYAYEHGGEDAQYAREYFSNGAEELTYFDGKEKLFNSKNVDDPWAKQKNSEAKKILGFIPSKISQASSFVERVPRLAEYIASRKAGASIDVAMLDAARVTTNFAAGGDVTKWANRNGATFLNASVQGAAQAVRNVREAKAKGLQGMLKLGAKVAIAGIPYLILNALLWGDDDEYEELSDYVKENYYIVAKYGDGQFVRIPKGRMAAVIQSAFDQISNLVTGDDEVDFKRFGELLVENIAPNNPLENNIFAPIKNVIENKTWYGDDLVPQRLQDLPAGEQSDETTDAISKWLGETINVSPYKLNYLLDQYSGVFGDMFLPTITPQAEGGNSSILGGAIAPLADQFTTDSTMKNQNVSDFYDTLDDLTASAKSKYATDEDVLRYRYMNTINSEMSNLYKKKREIQNSDLPNSEKYEAVREVQRQIDDLAKEALASYNDMSVGRNSATVGGITYKKNSKGEWQKVSESSSKSYKLWSDETLNNFIQEYKLPKVNWD